MTSTTSSTPPPVHPPSEPAAPAPPDPSSSLAHDPGAWALLRPVVLRVHFWAGLLVGPFLLVAAISGGLYAISPQIDAVVHRDVLRVDPLPAGRTPLPLSAQVEAAGAVADLSALVAVRPAPTASDSTRVMFGDPALDASRTRAVFVDPGTGQVLGSEVVYGTSGSLPARAWISDLHRSLHLGEAGRLYSELAASWLGVVALGGVALQVGRVRRARSARRLLRPDPTAVGRPATGGRPASGLPASGLPATGRARLRRWHGAVGLVAALGLVALSATGLTWSRFAGANVTELRAAAGWDAPALATALPAGPADPDSSTGAGAASGGGEHAGHAGHTTTATAGAATSDVGDVDEVLAAARAADITAAKVEIRLPEAADRAWVVAEIDRGTPTRVDAVAVDPRTDRVVGESRFADAPLMAKLARWGVDLHSGTLFGLANQIGLLLVAVALAALVVLGYRMWWSRRPAGAPLRRVPGGPPSGGLRRLPPAVLVVGALVVAVVGWFLPLLGASLVGFLVLDAVLGALRRRRPTAPGGSTGPDRVTA